MELYDKVFAAFGVSTSQFSQLMAHGTRKVGAPGGRVIKGGERFEKVALIVSGEAIAYRVVPGAKDGIHGDPVCKYIGKLTAASDLKDGNEHLPHRGSVIGGSALADKQVINDDYPHDVVASSYIDWVEWNIYELEKLIDAPRWRAVQACFYYQLYLDLLGTLDRARAAKMKKKEKLKDEVVPRPTARQLVQLSIFVAVPFCGFGFADNFIMIIAGDTIDAQFGAALGLTTLAAAGLGNWMSDVIGLGLGDAIERAALKLGLSDGKLTPGQEQLAVARLTTLSSKIIGITAGCFLGMVPLLFLTPKKKEFATEDLELYDQVFRLNGVSTDQFADLMERGTKKWAHAGAILVKGGEQYNKVGMLVRGEAAAYVHKEKGSPNMDKPVCVYVGRLGNEGRTREEIRAVPSRGSILGGTVMADPSKKGKLYPNDVVACKNIEWVEWDQEELMQLMSETRTIQASFYSMLYSELVQTISKDSQSQQLEKYEIVVAAVIQDGVINGPERAFVMAQKDKLCISDEEHYRILQEFGWSQEDWEKGSVRPHHANLARTFSWRRASGSGDRVAELQKAVSMIEGVMQSLEH